MSRGRPLLVECPSRIFRFRLRLDQAFRVQTNLSWRGFGQRGVRVTPFLSPLSIALTLPVAATAAHWTGNIFLLVALGTGLFFNQSVPFGYRDLIVIRVILGEVKKPVALPAIVHESGLE